MSMTNYQNVNDIRVANYASATTITQSFLTNTFLAGESQLQAICTITKGSNVIKVSSIPKYVGNTYYEGRAKLPLLKRTIGEFLSTTVQFSESSIEISNVDQLYTPMFVGGANYSTFIGASVVYQIGIADVSGSYINLFSGFVKNQAGTAKNLDSITFTAQDQFGIYNLNTNLPVITQGAFPSAPSDSVGNYIPVVMGDWTVGCNVVRVADVNVKDAGSGTDMPAITYTANSFYGGVLSYYIGGGNFIFATGNYTPDTISNAWLQRGNNLFALNFNSTAQVVGGYYAINVTSVQKSGGGTIGYTYQSGDKVIISVRVAYAASKYSNIIEQAQRLLIDILGVSISKFHSSWATLISKSTPSQSAITNISSRVWIGDNNTTILEYVASMLEQVRCEMFIDAQGLIRIRSLHFEDWPAVSSMRTIDQFQVVENSLKIELNDKTFMSGLSGTYAFSPLANATMLDYPLLTNSTSQTAIGGVPAQKTIDFPNLYVASDVQNQMTEFLRLFSFPLEYINVSTAWTGLLDELGDFINFNYNLADISYINCPCMIRDIEINLDSGQINYKLLSLYGFNYPNYTSGFANMLSSYNQTVS